LFLQEASVIGRGIGSGRDMAGTHRPAPRPGLQLGGRGQGQLGGAAHVWVCAGGGGGGGGGGAAEGGAGGAGGGAGVGRGAGGRAWSVLVSTPGFDILKLKSPRIDTYLDSTSLPTYTKTWGCRIKVGVNSRHSYPNPMFFSVFFKFFA
jgi:hypothetical protein